MFFEESGMVSLKGEPHKEKKMQQDLSEEQVKKLNELIPDKGASRTSIFLQLFLTHGITSALGLTLVFLSPYLGNSSVSTILGVIVIGGSLGLFLTANIVYEVHHAERAIIDTYRGHSITFPTFSWPLTPLFTRLSALNRQMQKYIQGEQATAEIRRQYLQQASESATRTERQRIARDLHDTIKQQLFSISVSAATAKAYWSKDSAKAQVAISDIQQVVAEAQVEMQALLQQLGSTPLENTKLADALRTQAEALKYRSGLEMKLTIGDLPADDLLPEGTQETIFRLVQESFANIARHARATMVTVTLQSSEKALHLMVSDNGKGFDPNTARAGMGLTNMRERVATLGGSIEVQSTPGQGTTIHITVPFLLPQSSVTDKTWSEHELKQGTERAISSFQLGNTAQSIALFFVASNGSNFFAQIPNIAIVICLFIALYGLWQGHSWKGRLLPHLGRESIDGLKLQQREEHIIRLLLIILFSAAFHFMPLLKGLNAILLIGGLIVFFLLFIVLQLLFAWRLYRRQGRIYRVMTRDELRREMADQRSKTIRHAKFLLTGVLAAILLGEQLIPSHLPTDTIHLGIMLFIACFIIGCYLLLHDLLALWRQRRALGEGRHTVSLSAIWGGE
jgi:signal transduction histidine kinase